MRKITYLEVSRVLLRLPAWKAESGHLKHGETYQFGKSPTIKQHDGQ